MNKKLILAAIAVALSVGASQASNITGVTPTGNTFNITPEHYSGNAAYRKYDNFVLDQGHIANLNFVDREGKPTEAFVNLVGSKVQVNGLLNTVKGNNFYNGHAIFITPGGMVVGQSGVLNVGRLSVATPNASTYNNMVNGYGTDGFDYAAKIGRNVTKLTQNSQGNANAADVEINGKIFARERVEIGGKNVAVPGNIVNGVRQQQALTTEEAADALFESLVNTDGTIKNSNLFVSNKDRILIKSAQGLDVSGTVTNTGDVYLTNNGADGLKVSGGVYSSKLNRAFNTAGNLQVLSGAHVEGNKVVLQNKGTNLTTASGSEVVAAEAQLINQGSGQLHASGSTSSGGNVVIKNQGAGGLTVDGNVSGRGQVAINNLAGAMVIDSNVTNTGNTGIINKGTGATITKNTTIQNTGKLKIANTGANGLTVVGNVNNNGETRVYNDGGKLTLGTDSAGTTAAQFNNKNGKLYIAARKDATGISQSTASNVVNENGNIVIRNSGTKVASGARGLDLQGGVQAKGTGTVAINNDMGDMYVSSNVQVADGNLGIINRAGGNEMTFASAGKVNVAKGNANIKNYGLGNMNVNGEITHTGRVNVLANSGALNLNSTVHNNSGALNNNSGFYAAARQQGTGVNVTSAFVADGTGEVLIKNISGAEGLRYAGKINTTGQQAALVNHKGAMNVSGSIKTTKAPIVVSSKGDKLTVTNTTNLNSGTKGNLFVHLNSPDPSVSPNATLTNMEGHGKLKGKI